jgi:hypothetical protein
VGWRYRSSIRLLPGLRVNLSKSGASLSLGRRGATVNLGRRGIRGTVGLPGTGISYSETAPWHQRAGEAAKSNAAPLLGILALVAIVASLIATR